MSEYQSQIWVESFSPREVEVLELIAEGLSNREISQNLHLSLETIKWYNKQIFSKLGVSNRTKAVIQAKKLNVLGNETDNEVEENIISVHNLPYQITSYIGRKSEITEVLQLLSQNRIVTLTGPGGSGKTRLALKVSEKIINNFDNGVWLIDLTKIRDSGLVLSSIAKVLNISLEKDLLKNIVNSLYNRQTLLILDNMEHLLDAAPLIAELLAASPKLSVLATSREKLHIKGEIEFVLEPLALPDMMGDYDENALLDVESISLFINRAKTSKQNLTLDKKSIDKIAEICLKLDGLPLAIELCAPLVKVFPLSTILKKISKNLDFIPLGPRDLPARQQTLLNTLEWSRDLLSDDEKKIFDRMAVFAGGGTLEAIEKICKEGVSESISSILSSLVNKNLINAKEIIEGHIHFNLLETIRQYNQIRLIKNKKWEKISKFHGHYYLQLAKLGETYLRGKDQVEWLEYFDTENNNFRAALNWAKQDTRSSRIFIQLATSLGPFWSLRGYVTEGRKYIEDAISKYGTKDKSLVKANALNNAALLSYFQSDYATTRIFTEESIHISNNIGKNANKALATAKITLGDMESELGNYDIATELMKNGLKIMRKENYTRGVARGLWQIGSNYVRNGKFKEAEKYLNESLPFLRSLGERDSLAIAISSLAEIAIRQGEIEKAEKLEQESYSLRKEVDAPWGIAVSLGHFAWISLERGDLEKSLDYLSQSIEIRYKFGDVGGIAWCVEKMAKIELIKGEVIPLSNVNSHFQRAVQLLGFAFILRKSINSSMDLVDKLSHGKMEKNLINNLEKTEFENLFSIGGNMNLDNFMEKYNY